MIPKSFFHILLLIAIANTFNSSFSAAQSFSPWKDLAGNAAVPGSQGYLSYYCDGGTTNSPINVPGSAGSGNVLTTIGGDFNFDDLNFTTPGNNSSSAIFQSKFSYPLPEGDDEENPLNHIFLENATGINIGFPDIDYTNEFTQKGYGIFSANSSFNAFNNKFSDLGFLEYEEPGVPIKHGGAIFAKSDDATISTVVIDDNSTGFPNKFINCHTGIFASGIANLTIQKNNKDAQDGGFEACYNSIMIYNAPENSVTTVTANDATDYNYGLQMFDLGQNSKFYVDGNWFNCDNAHNPLSFNASTASYKAISIQNILTVEVLGTVLGNIISNTQKGIHLRNIANHHAGQLQIGIANPNPNLYSNQVHYLNAPAPTGNDHYFGYWFENCDNLEVDNNIALSNTIPLGNGIDKRFRGFSVDNTTNSNFCSNKAEQMGSGMWVYNKCGGTYFMGTNTTGNWHNFHMANADLPDQDGSGHDLNNAWSYAGSTYDFAGSLANGVFVYWYTDAYLTTIKETGPGLQFFSIVDQTSGSISNCQTAQAPADERRRENFGSAVTDTTDYGEDFPEENKYQDKEAFYNAALKDSTILALGLPDDVVFQNAFDSLNQTSIAAIAEVKQLLDSDNVSAAMVVNNVIAPVNTIETNSKAAHQLLAAYKQYDSLTSAQKGQAHSIAVQTSLEGGMDVYTMRALLNEDVVDDIDASANMRKAHHQDDAVQKEYVKNKDKLYPNPAANSVTFESSHEFTDNDVLVVYNLLQQAIAEYKLVGKSKNYSFNISWLQQSIYYVKHIRGSTIVSENKLVIIR